VEADLKRKSLEHAMQGYQSWYSDYLKGICKGTRRTKGRNRLQAKEEIVQPSRHKVGQALKAAPVTARPALANLTACTHRR
jgi:hypothetical protein